MSRSTLHPVVAGAAAAAVFAVTSAARAELSLAADAELGIRTTDGLKLGGGFNGRVGYRFKLGPVYLLPEVGAGYMRFESGVHPSRVFVGGRFGYAGSIFQPHIFGHVGYGWIGSGVDLNNAINYHGITYNGGAGIDFQIIKLLSLGVHGAYTRNDGVVGVNWLSFGVNASVLLF